MKVGYRIKPTTIGKNIGGSSLVSADNLDHAFEIIKAKHNIELTKEYYPEGSLYAGLLWRQYFSIGGVKVNIELTPSA